MATKKEKKDDWKNDSGGVHCGCRVKIGQGRGRIRIERNPRKVSQQAEDDWEKDAGENNDHLRKR